MEIIDATFLFFVTLFGVIVGSFLNVVVYRFGGGGGLSGRSRCLSCGKTLTPLMLVPILSFVLQGGRCRHCKARISPQYPLVEALTGFAFLLSALAEGLSLSSYSGVSALLFLCSAAAWATLIVITVYDLRHKIIPDRFSLLFTFFVGILLLLKYQQGIFPESYIPIFDVVPWWIDIAAGPLLFLPFALLWLFSRGRAMGLGDAKLSFGIGWFLGFSGGVSAIVLGFWIAFFPSLALLFLRGKHFTMKSEIPFAPFLVLGTLAVYAFHIDLFSWTL